MKRAHPFGDHLLPRVKVHLMDYEVDSSVLKKIQEKTLKMVMNGPRNFTSPAAEGGFPLSDVEPKKSLRQTEVTNYFNCVGEGRSKSQDLRRDTRSPELKGCAYCDMATVAAPCYKCGDNFCEACSFVSYGYGNDARVCVSCT